MGSEGTRMKKLLIVAVFALVSVFGIASLPTETAKAADKKPATSEQKKTYQYAAQAGDSYTQLARKAVQSYGIDNKVNLSLAQIVFAETHLTSNAGFPELNEGETVSFTKESLKATVDHAQKLTADEKAAWEYYVPSIDFNTNAIGE